MSEADSTISVDVIVMSDSEDLDADMFVTAKIQGMGTAVGGYMYSLISRWYGLHACVHGWKEAMYDLLCI